MTANNFTSGSKNLLVTLADEKFVDMAKQLFSSVYFNAGWKGDYMLLSHQIPEEKLKWFRGKRILVRECQPLSSKNIGAWSPVLVSKFYIFTEEFKKWDKVIFLDADTIVRASLDKMTDIRGFAAVIDLSTPLLFQFVKETAENTALFCDLRKSFNLHEAAFNAAAMAFNTDIITERLFSESLLLLERYKDIALLGDQPFLNLLFHKKWEKLPIVYDIHGRIFGEPFWDETQKEGIEAIVLHGQKGQPDHLFYEEWKENFDRAESIDLDKVLPPRKVWTEDEIRYYDDKFEKLFNRTTKDFIMKEVRCRHTFLDILKIRLGRYFPELYRRLKAIYGRMAGR